jgi:hypothetical protein
MLRSVCAVLVSVIAWFLVATVGNLLVRILVPGYTEVEVAMSFTLPMLICRLGIGLISSLCAGILCATVARSNGLAVKVFAGLMVILFLPVHYNLWPKFPVWYHIFFLGTLAPAILLGALLRSRYFTMHTSKRI